VTDPTIEDFELEQELAAQAKKDLNTATIRTTVPMFWTAAIIYVAKRYGGVELSEDQAIALLPAAAVVGGVLYRIARIIEERYPKIGFILLGSNKKPNFYLK